MNALDHFAVSVLRSARYGGTKRTESMPFAVEVISIGGWNKLEALPLPFSIPNILGKDVDWSVESEELPACRV